MPEETIRIAARSGGGCIVRRGQTIRVIDVEGQQVLFSRMAIARLRRGLPFDQALLTLGLR